MLADDNFDLREARVDVADSLEGRPLLASSPRTFELQGTKLELVHVPLMGMHTGAENHGESSEFLHALDPRAHALDSFLGAGTGRPAERMDCLEMLPDDVLDRRLKPLAAAPYDLR
jgi:hypothetical protein